VILAFFVIITQVLLGFAIVSWVGIKVSKLEKSLYAIISGFLIGNSVIFILNLLLGLNPVPIILSILLMLSFSGFIIITQQSNIFKKIKFKKLNFSIFLKNLIISIKKNYIQIIFFILLLLLLLNLHFTHYLEPKSDGLYSGGSTWGDVAIHLSVISSFLENSNSNLENPIYAGTPLSYNFMVDFATAVLVASGISLRSSLLLTGIFLSFSLFLLFYFLAKTITKNIKISVIAVLLLLFTGGFGFAYYFQDTSDYNLFPSKDYTNYPEKNIYFWNLIGSIILPQRAFLVGFTVAFIIFSILWEWTNKKSNPKELIFAGLLIGLLPLFNWHVFFSLGFVSFLLFLIDTKLKIFNKSNLKSKRIITWIIFFVIIFILSFPQVLWAFSSIAGNIGKGILDLQLGWMAENHNWLAFWTLNLGFLFILVIPAFIFVKREFKIFYIPFIFLFFLANLIKFQPWISDNIKIFYIWVPLNSILVASFLYKIYKKSIILKFSVFIVIFLSISSGALSVIYETRLSSKLFDNKDMELANWVKENIPKNSIFLTSTQHNHFIPTLTGRHILMGYKGWLWSYGIDYSEREKDIKSIYAGTSESIELLKKYDVDYVVIGLGEKSEFSVNEKFFTENFEIVKDFKGYKIFKT